MAAAHAKEAVSVAKEETQQLKNSLDDSRKERAEQFDTLIEKQDADLKSWKAYHTKDPQDMNKAAEALSKVESKFEEHQAARAVGQPPPSP